MLADRTVAGKNWHDAVVCLTLCQSVRPSVRPSVCLSACLHLSVCLSVTKCIVGLMVGVRGLKLYRHEGTSYLPLQTLLLQDVSIVQPRHTAKNGTAEISMSGISMGSLVT